MQEIRVHVNPDHVKVEMDGESTDYISIETEANESREQEPDQMDTGDANEVDYRSIETPKKPGDVENIIAQEEDTVGESFDEYVKRRTIELNRQLDEVKYPDVRYVAIRIFLTILNIIYFITRIHIRPNFG
jgi:hypothetical protein